MTHNRKEPPMEFRELVAAITDEELRHEDEVQAQEAEEQDNAEYEDGFGFALDWQPGHAVPPLDSRAWEAGVAAGMERNDPTTRAAWEQANRA